MGTAKIAARSKKRPDVRGVRVRIEIDPSSGRIDLSRYLTDANGRQLDYSRAHDVARALKRDPWTEELSGETLGSAVRRLAREFLAREGLELEEPEERPGKKAEGP